MYGIFRLIARFCYAAKCLVYFGNGVLEIIAKFGLIITNSDMFFLTLFSSSVHLAVITKNYSVLANKI